MIISTQISEGELIYQAVHTEVEKLIPFFEELSHDFKIASERDKTEIFYMIEEFPQFKEMFGGTENITSQSIKENMRIIDEAEDESELINKAEAIYYNQKQLGVKMNDAQDKFMHHIADIIRKDIRRKDMNDLPMTLTSALKRLITILLLGGLTVVNPVLGIIAIIGTIGGYSVKNMISRKIRSDMIYELESEVKIVDQKLEDINNNTASDDISASKYDLMKVSQELHHTIDKLKKAQGEM